MEPQTHIARERNGNLSCGTTSVSVDNTSVPHLSAPTQPVQDLGSGASQHDISVSTQPIQDLNSGTSQHGFPVSPQNVYTETQVIMKDDDDQVQAELSTIPFPVSMRYTNSLNKIHSDLQIIKTSGHIQVQVRSENILSQTPLIHKPSKEIAHPMTG